MVGFAPMRETLIPRHGYEDFLRQRGLTAWKPRDLRRAAFEDEGGFTERLYRVRTAGRRGR